MKPTGRIHAGHPMRCPRLRRVWAFLAQRGQAGATTLDIIREAQVCAVNSIIAELRAGGVRIECERERTAETGAAVYRYRVEAADRDQEAALAEA